MNPCQSSLQFLYNPLRYEQGAPVREMTQLRDPATPRYLRSNFQRGVKSLPIRWRIGISIFYDDRVMMEVRRRNFVHPGAASKDHKVRCSHIIGNVRLQGANDKGIWS